MKRYVIGNRKVAVIGAGHVGASIAYALAIRDIAREIVLIDRSLEKAEAEAKDIRYGIPSMGTADLHAGGYSDCENCDMIIITVGRSRRHGESRLDMAEENVGIVSGVIRAMRPYYTRGAILVVSNPVDILTQKVSDWMGLYNGTVFGSGCILDTSRLVRSIADYTGLSTGVVNGYVVGEHGDNQVPIWSRMTVGGIPIREYCAEMSIPWDDQTRAAITEKTTSMGADIIKGKSRTYYGVATCVCYLADAILNQRPMIASVTSPIRGEYGIRGVSLSVPSVVGPGGVQQRIREKWTQEEHKSFLDAAEKVKSVLDRLNI